MERLGSINPKDEMGGTGDTSLRNEGRVVRYYAHRPTATSVAFCSAKVAFLGAAFEERKATLKNLALVGQPAKILL